MEVARPVHGVTVEQTRAAQELVAAGGPWRENRQANDWVGKPIAEALGLDPKNKAPGYARELSAFLDMCGRVRRICPCAGKDSKRRQKLFIEAGELLCSTSLKKGVERGGGRRLHPDPSFPRPTTPLYGVWGGVEQGGGGRSTSRAGGEQNLLRLAQE